MQSKEKTQRVGYIDVYCFEKAKTLLLFFHVLAGLCMVLVNKSSIDIYDCHTFVEGCPDKSYFSHDMFLCKIFISLCRHHSGLSEMHPISDI